VPFCEDCGRLAVEVDHVAGWAVDPTHSLLASLCHECHTKRTARRRRPGAYPKPRRTTAWPERV
jgi:hypothetical protein